jgi:hypothetical protein
LDLQAGQIIAKVSDETSVLKQLMEQHDATKS